ncbi:hypothetical protein NL676_037823 [Syzygium grande]|nr:hypothetical protein NL676_037823 [Syzygium grande]
MRRARQQFLRDRDGKGRARLACPRERENGIFVNVARAVVTGAALASSIESTTSNEMATELGWCSGVAKGQERREHGWKKKGAQNRAKKLMSNEEVLLQRRVLPATDRRYCGKWGDPSELFECTMKQEEDGRRSNPTYESLDGVGFYGEIEDGPIATACRGCSGFTGK